VELGLKHSSYQATLICFKDKGNKETLLLLTKINEAPKLKAVVFKQVKMGKNKSIQLPKFIYYHLLKGIQNLFKGVVELFRFRWRKKLKEYYKKEVKKQRFLFPEMHPKNGESLKQKL
jgi:hypothetical protein